MPPLPKTLHPLILSSPNPKIVLLRNKEVLMWLYGDLSFLPTNPTTPEPTPNKKSNKKLLEDTWGQKTLKERRPDLKLDKQWTNTAFNNLIFRLSKKLYSG